MLRKDKSLRWLTRKRVIVPRGRALHDLVAIVPGRTSANFFVKCDIKRDFPICVRSNVVAPLNPASLDPAKRIHIRRVDLVRRWLRV